MHIHALHRRVRVVCAVNGEYRRCVEARSTLDVVHQRVDVWRQRQMIWKLELIALPPVEFARVVDLVHPSFEESHVRLRPDVPVSRTEHGRDAKGTLLPQKGLSVDPVDGVESRH